MLETAPALIYCDAVQKVCSMKDENYILELLKICEKEQIDMLIPTIDTDLLVLSQNVEKFEQIGTKVLVSKTDKIAVCRNKNLTADFFASCGLKAPKTVNNYQDYKGTYPCFIKPKDGSSSINAFKVENESELEVYAGQIEDYIIQPFIEGTEYTVDIFCDYEGKAIFVIPRVRMAVRAGEVLKTKITMDERIIAECQKLSQCIITAFCASTGANNQGVYQTDEMSGLNWCSIPATIVEMGYMTNQEEDTRMQTADYQQQMVTGIADGIDQYFAS